MSIYDWRVRKLIRATEKGKLDWQVYYNFAECSVKNVKFQVSFSGEIGDSTISGKWEEVDAELVSQLLESIRNSQIVDVDAILMDL